MSESQKRHFFWEEGSMFLSLSIPPHALDLDVQLRISQLLSYSLHTKKNIVFADS